MTSFLNGEMVSLAITLPPIVACRAMAKFCLGSTSFSLLINLLPADSALLLTVTNARASTFSPPTRMSTLAASTGRKSRNSQSKEANPEETDFSLS